MDEKEQSEEVYPEALLPMAGDNGYLPEITLSDIYPGQRYFTQRRACCPKEECVRMGEVTFKALYNENVPDDKKGYDLIGFSVNMMGTPHIPEYGKWHQKNPASKPWDGNEVNITDYKKCYDWEENQAFVYLDAGLLEGLDFPFVRRLERDTFEKYKDVPDIYNRAFSRLTDYPIKGIIRHFHAPSFLNYWHAEIWIFDQYLKEKVKYLKSNPEWKERIQRRFLESLRAHAIADLPADHAQIPPAAYRKSQPHSHTCSMP